MCRSDAAKYKDFGDEQKALADATERKLQAAGNEIKLLTASIDRHVKTTLLPGANAPAIAAAAQMLVRPRPAVAAPAAAAPTTSSAAPSPVPVALGVSSKPNVLPTAVPSTTAALVTKPTPTATTTATTTTTSAAPASGSSFNRLMAMPLIAGGSNAMKNKENQPNRPL